MELKSLVIKNIASIESARIDFCEEPLRDEAIFLICGETGAGKSTILDAICLALYNQAPRLAAAAKEWIGDDALPAGKRDPEGDISTEDPKQFLRKGAVEASVTLVFTGLDGMDYTSNILTINEPIPANGILRKLVPIVDIKNIPDVNQTTHTIKFVREIEFKGNVSADVKGATNEEMSSMIVATEFNIPNFEIEKVKGTFIPDIKVNAENLDMGDIPDALANENTSLNVNTIATTLEIDNPAGIPFYTDLLFTAFDKNNQKINSEVTARIYIPAAIDFSTSKVSKYYLTNNSNLKAPDGYELVLIPELNQMIKQIPAHISLSPTVTVDESKEHFAQLGIEHNTTANYDVEMPFDFGENSKIEYTESFDGIQDDLTDFIDKITEMEVYADIYNTIPLNLVLNTTPYDWNGQDMSDRVDISQDILIEPGNGNAPAQSKEILLKEKVKGALKDLDRIEIKINGDTKTANTVLKPSQYVVIKMKAKLPQGIAVNLDEE